MVLISKNVDETKEIGARLATWLDTNGSARAFIALRGEMGVGKTAFTAGFASHFGICGVKSPTYTVLNQYSSEKVKIYHYDMYRIADEDDLYSIGFDDYISADGYSLAEWSENIPYAIPEDAIFVTIERTENGEAERRITVESSAGEITI